MSVVYISIPSQYNKKDKPIRVYLCAQENIFSLWLDNIIAALQFAVAFPDLGTTWNT